MWLLVVGFCNMVNAIRVLIGMPLIEWGGEKIGGGKWFGNLTFLLILRLIVKPKGRFAGFLVKSTNRNILKVRKSCIVISAHDVENSLLRNNR